MVDSLLLGEGVIATNHAFQGDPLQIGFFNGVNSNIGLDSGIVISTGDINEVVPGIFGSFITNDSTNPVFDNFTVKVQSDEIYLTNTLSTY